MAPAPTSFSFLWFQNNLLPAASPRASGTVRSWLCSVLPSLSPQGTFSWPVCSRGSCCSLEVPEDRGLALPHPQIPGSGTQWAQHDRPLCPSPSWMGLGEGATEGGGFRWPWRKQTWAAGRGLGSCPGNPPADSTAAGRFGGPGFAQEWP